MADPEVSESELDDLREQVASLDEEVVTLRRRLADAPKRVRTLEERLLETKGQLSQAVSQNEKLTYTLREAREHIAALREEVDKLTQPPSAYGTYLGPNDDGTVDVFSGGRKMRVAAPSRAEAGGAVRGHGGRAERQPERRPRPGRRRLRRGRHAQGDPRGRSPGADRRPGRRGAGRRDGRRAHPAQDESASAPATRSSWTPAPGLLLEKLPRPEVEELVLEEVPDISYEDVGGLENQIEEIRDAVELPFLHRDLFSEYSLPAPKGILLYGPPGCGKTLIAKAVANSLSKKVSEVTGRPAARSYFLNIKGPELLNKYVGETERQIRLVFQRAREKSEEGVPVIVFFDEMDSLFRTRGSGISLRRRVDDRSPAPRGDRRRRVPEERDRDRRLEPRGADRPGDPPARSARREDQDRAAGRGRGRADLRLLPHVRPPARRRRGAIASGGGDPEKAIRSLIERNGRRHVLDERGEPLPRGHLPVRREGRHVLQGLRSGAMIENIVRRAKKLAIKREIAGLGRGIKAQDLLDSIQQEFREHEDLPNTTNPNDWLKISGKKGERIVYVRTLITRGKDEEPLGGRAIERASTGQYL